ncbi:unnamed protein product [Rotaria sordida]|uniref:Uncharacterized protein n=1 Tax=Rotaria sordida TaxID=392033 RepID=A0A814I3U7_9BILA|nr:unnamed protein product [Rotaria sordida]CAF1540894.1 unnamed protein product [Rotaria sordida]
MNKLCPWTQPPPEFVGEWWDGTKVRMHIWKDGSVNYTVDGIIRRTYQTDWSYYDRSGFCAPGKCCLPMIGTYDGRIPDRPAFIFKGSVLTKQPEPRRGALLSETVKPAE